MEKEMSLVYTSSEIKAVVFGSKRKESTFVTR